MKVYTKIKFYLVKTQVDKLDIHILVCVPVDLSKLSDVVKNDVSKEAVYNKLAAKVNNVDTSKIPDTSGLVKKTDYDAKITEIEGKIPNISGLATMSELAVVDNKISDL